MSFGVFGDSERIFKSWAPQLRDLLARVLKLEIDEFVERETLTTKKIFGKPVYRKVVDVGTLPNTTTKNVSHGIGDYERIVSIRGFASAGNDRITLPFNGTTLASMIATYVNTTNIVIITGSDRTSFEGFVILEYTRS